MAELKTDVDKKLMSNVAECFLQYAKESTCLTDNCDLTGFLNPITSGDLHPEGLYPFSIADPVKLEGSGWVKDDYVKGDTCEDIYKLVDATVPVTDPETEFYATDGTSLSGRWIHTIKASGWRSDHPTYPYWDNSPIPALIDSGIITNIVIYDKDVYFKNAFSSMFTTNVLLPPVVLATANDLAGVGTSYNGSNQIFIFRLGLTESSVHGTADALYPIMAEAINKTKPLDAKFIMSPPVNSPQHLTEVYRQLSLDLGCVYLPSVVPIDSNTVLTTPNYIDLRIAYWLMNEVLSTTTAGTLTMYTPNPTQFSVTDIIKHLDIEMRTP